ncbi:hypothetical protein BJ138DRAFT_1114625 [Hygrophoropsis aurantiaca]|uniref:Uncharacterized protein n=1 Tax=Hygrophoropsis aurantiaca TaxID=72124 RepID=A0ACB8A9R0_9AGAM|nr:hypothetical protein BJ138DRAFT_1114625 [Hygrophoropsis aurantiaca]
MAAEPVQIVDATQIHYLKIYPPIGIARVGNSGFDLEHGKPDGEIISFLPSEIPGTKDIPATLNGRFKDDKHRIKRQSAQIRSEAVLFHVYAYDRDGNILGEITSEKDYKITWTVHVANHKGAYYGFAGEYRKPVTSLRNPDVDQKQACNILEPDGRKRLIVNSEGEITAGSDPVDLIGEFHGSQSKGTKVNLGQIQADARGRLIFIGGAGYSRCVSNPKKEHFQPDIISEFDSIDWVDDTCDGWVDVKIIHPKLLAAPRVHKATVMSAPPKFAWGIQAPTTLYDLLENIYHENAQWEEHKRVKFYEDIWPVLESTYELSWVNEAGYTGHGVAGTGNFLPLMKKLADPKDEEGQVLRQHIFKRLRRPGYQDLNQASTKFMPRLSGNDGDAIEPGTPLRPGEQVPPIKRFAALTKLQYERFEKWAKGDFDAEEARWNAYQKDALDENALDKVDLDLQPYFLTRAALEHTTGEPLYPGIEVHWSARNPEMYMLDKDNWNDNNIPFRVNHELTKPGHICRGLSLPWQSDFDLCNTHWWPSTRPDDVINIKAVEKALEHSTNKSGTIPVDKFLADISPARKKWARKLRKTPDYPSEYYPGSTDMIRYWNYLGFVRKSSDYTIGDDKLPMWIEKERMHIDHAAPPKHADGVDVQDAHLFELPFVTPRTI